jgi:hypothetical protein
VNDHLVVPAVARLYTKVTGQPAPPPPPDPFLAGNSMMDAKKAGQQRPYIAIPGYQPGDAITKAEAICEAARQAIYRKEAEDLALPPEKLDRYLAARTAHAREWIRATDLESPAPRGHYLRDFGQSDRGLVENANLEATMPQALVLMNSPLVRQVLSPYSQLSWHVASASTPQEQAEAVYLTILSRRPTSAELAAWEAARADGLDRIEDLVFALVNSRQFLFLR